MDKRKINLSEATAKEKETKFFELLVTLFFSGLAIYLLYIAYTTEKVSNTQVFMIKAMTIPKIVLYVMLVLSLVVLWQTLSWYFHHGWKNVWPAFLKLIPLRTLLTFLLVIVYVKLWDVLGFSISTFLFFAVESKLCKPEQSIGKTLLISLIFSVAVYLIFVVGFSMFLPEPILDLIIYG